MIDVQDDQKIQLKIDTKTRILDTAERLFAENGFDRTSLRDITREASVNLAAVNYHFQSRDSLISAVIARRIMPVNKERLQMLDEFEASAGGLTPENVSEAFVVPVLEAGARFEYMRPMMGRMLAAPNEFLKHVFETHLAAVGKRFVEALGKALPDVPQTELVWRLHFMAGVMSHIIAWSRVLPIMTNGACDLTDTKAVSKRMIAFIAAGLRAPSPF